MGKKKTLATRLCWMEESESRHSYPKMSNTCKHSYPKASGPNARYNGGGSDRCQGSRTRIA